MKKVMVMLIVGASALMLMVGCEQQADESKDAIQDAAKQVGSTAEDVKDDTVTAAKDVKDGAVTAAKDVKDGAVTAGDNAKKSIDNLTD